MVKKYTSIVSEKANLGRSKRYINHLYKSDKAKALRRIPEELHI